MYDDMKENCLAYLISLYKIGKMLHSFWFNFIRAKINFSEGLFE